MEPALENEGWEPAYRTQALEQCSAAWLRVLSAPKIIESLLSNLNAVLEEHLSQTATGIGTLLATTNVPLQNLNLGLIDAAKQLNFSAIITQWQDAQAALGVDPPDATTRASSLIESLCKHILETRNAPIPLNQTIQSLYGAAARVLSIAPEQQTTADLKRIAGAMNTLVLGIGTLRTHEGTAHGRGSIHEAINFSHARFAVNAAGVLATFLMDALLAESQSSSAATD